MNSFLGTIRYGNRPPIQIGSVFARVHMLKTSCEREQPLVFFFDLCQRENPCFNGGTCQSLPPDYKDASLVPSQLAEVNYHCLCPSDTYGEHCQHRDYPFGYCMNGGTLLETVNVDNRPQKFCMCPQGFFGDHCEQNKDDCDDVTCSNHGICHDGINNYTCECYDGYFGKICDQKNIETVILHAVSKSFAIVAISLIAAIALLFIISDIHTYLTRSERISGRTSRAQSTRPRVSRNEVSLLVSDDVILEMDNSVPKPSITKAKFVRNHSSTGYYPLSVIKSTASLSQDDSENEFSLDIDE